MAQVAKNNAVPCPQCGGTSARRIFYSLGLGIFAIFLNRVKCLNCGTVYQAKTGKVTQYGKPLSSPVPVPPPSSLPPKRAEGLPRPVSLPFQPSAAGGKCYLCGQPFSTGEGYCIPIAISFTTAFRYMVAAQGFEPRSILRSLVQQGNHYRGDLETPTNVCPECAKILMPELAFSPAKETRSEPSSKNTIYFEVQRPVTGPGRCSDDACPCPPPGTLIPQGSGYLYISKEVVEFRMDALNLVEARMKIEMMKARMGYTTAIGLERIAVPVLMCEQGARLRGLDLEVAAADAKYWWETGLAPLRPTPLAGKSD